MDVIVRLAGVATQDEFRTVIHEAFMQCDNHVTAGSVYVVEDGLASGYVCSYPACLKNLELKRVKAFYPLAGIGATAAKPTCVNSFIVPYKRVELLGVDALHSHHLRQLKRTTGEKSPTDVRITFLRDIDDDDCEATRPVRIIAIVPIRSGAVTTSIDELVGQTMIATQKRLQRHLRPPSDARSGHMSLSRQKTCPPTFHFEDVRRERRHSDPPDLFSYYRSLMVTDNVECECGQQPADNRKIDQALLELCASLYNLTHAELQLKILNYCIKDRLLEPELRFPVNEENFFSKVIASSRPTILDTESDLPPAALKDVQFFLAEHLHSLLCVPIVNRTNSGVVALVCLANKTFNANVNREQHFSMHDVCVVQRCFVYTMPVLTSVIAFQSEQRLRKQTQSLLKVAKNIFRCVDNLNQLLREIMAEASNLTGAERCSLFVYDGETDQLVARVFDCSNSADGVEAHPHAPEVRISATTGIAGEVFSKGRVLNIKDAYSNPHFYKGVDETTGFKTRNLLCFPLQDESGKIVAVAELCNKQNGPYFTDADAEIAKAFGMFCCISLSQSLMYKRVQEEHYRAKLANELMTYHMHIQEKSVESLAQRDPLPVTAFLPNFASFQSIPRDVPEKDTLCAVLSMFDDLGLTSQFRINRKTLCRFVHAVKLGYRDPPYHNWSHAFSAAHFAYLCLKNFPLDNYLTDIERFALFVASLCHDIDHRGTNNSFQVVSKSTLACLYSSAGSVLERHHVAQTLCILNADGSQILENLSDSDYKIMIDRIRDIILATDVANHLRSFDNIKKLSNGRFDRANDDHHVLLVSLLMTAADLSDQTKKWSNSKRASSLLYREFFSQGDLEKQLGYSPALMMDRARACVPDLQVSFLDGIALPVYDTLSELFPQAAVVAAQCKRNRENWNALLDKVKTGALKENVDIFQERLVDDDFDLCG